VGGLQKEKENPMFWEFLFSCSFSFFLVFLLEVPKGTLNLRKTEGKGKGKAIKTFAFSC